MFIPKCRTIHLRATHATADKMAETASPPSLSAGGARKMMRNYRPAGTGVASIIAGMLLRRLSSPSHKRVNLILD